MLAQNFMTAAELGISKKVHAAFVVLLGKMERREIPENEFNMGDWGEGRDGCGTARCIGGWVELLMGEPDYFVEVEPGESALGDLFYPPFCDGKRTGYDATLEQGAAALRNYLTLGKAYWHDVMPEVCHD